MTEPAAILRLLNVHHGHPDEVIESLRADPALFPCASYFLPVVQSERSSLDHSLRRLRTLAEIIAPALGWRPIVEHIGCIGCSAAHEPFSSTPGGIV